MLSKVNLTDNPNQNEPPQKIQEDIKASSKKQAKVNTKKRKRKEFIESIVEVDEEILDS